MVSLGVNLGLSLRQYGSRFNPASLFSGGAAGAFYDLSDMSTLFQNAAGTTPVTAVEQPVGLVLDKSRGLVLGPELANGALLDKRAATDGTVTRADGIITFTSAAAGLSTAISQEITGLTIGRAYQVVANVRYVSGAGVTLEVRSGSGGGGSGLASTAPTLSVEFVPRALIWLATATSAHFSILAPTNSVFEVDEASFSVRELPGNHATQSTSANRPTYSRRYNLLTNTDFALGTTSVTDWTMSAGTGLTATIVARGVDSSGRGYVDIRWSGTNSSGSSTFPSFQSATAATLTGANYNISLRVALVAGSMTGFSTPGFMAQWRQGSDLFLTNFTVDSTIPSADAHEYAASVLAPASATGLKANWAMTVANGVTVDATLRFSMAQLLTAADHAATGGAYQRVAAATDYDTSNPVWRPYLRFDGTDDSLATASIDFSGTDEMTVFAGLTKLSDAAFAIVTELTADINTNNSAFAITAPSGSATPTFGAVSKGTASGSATYNNAAVAAPVSVALTINTDISGDSAILRINGSQVAQSVANQGTGNFGNYPLYIGARGGSSSRFNGRLYGLIVVGKTTSAKELAATEKWVAGKTGVTLA